MANPTFVTSHSAMSDYKTCRYLYLLKKVKRIKTIARPAPLIAGSGFHAYVEEGYKGKEERERTEALLNVFKDEDTSLLSKQQLERLDVEKARVLAMATSYWRLHGAFDMQESFVEVRPEEKFCYPLIEGVELLGYIDNLVKDKNGLWWIMEHKTSSKSVISPAYWSSKSFDDQLLTEMWGAKQILGAYPAGVIFNTVCKTTHRRKQTETHAVFCKRLVDMYQAELQLAECDRELIFRKVVTFSAKRLESWEKGVKLLAKEMGDAVTRKETSWPRNTRQCHNVYGACDMLDICVTGQVERAKYKIDKKRK